MGRRVRRRVETSFNLASFQVDDDHVVRRERRVIDPSWLGREHGSRAVETRALGRTGLNVTSVCVGTSALGGFPAQYGYGVIPL